MLMNKLIIIIVFCMCYKYCYTKEQELNSSLILTDIRRAFQKVTNQTRVVNELLPKMYDLNKTNPEVVFKLTQKSGAIIIRKTRNCFFDPQFPDVTRGSKAQEDYVPNKPLPFVEQTNLSSKQTLIKMWSNKYDENYAWSMMGLSGWSGVISKPLKIIPKANKINEKPNTDMIFDNGDTVEDYNSEERYSNQRKGLNSTRFMYSKSHEKGINKREDFEQMYENENIYLARANDPFGYSTNWKLRSPFEPPSNHSSIRPDNRLKRDALRLYSMIKCSTGCEPLMYKRYGCYCGFLGAGSPVDGIDICCKLHDKCYEYSNCISYLEYFVPYIWKCYRGKPLCAVDHGEWGGPRSCAARLCKCDMRLSRCLKKFVCPQKRLSCKTLPVGHF